ncbi:uncharacterized protein [Dysidea avara]|uniref:uncharacterized protein n=1 Tax=Dysidea avara TaxID=196820 RepID=UPI003318F3E5
MEIISTIEGNTDSCVLLSGDINNQPSISNAQGPAGIVECTSSTIIDQHQYPETDDPLTELPVSAVVNVSLNEHQFDSDPCDCSNDSISVDNNIEGPPIQECNTPATSTPSGGQQVESDTSLPSLEQVTSSSSESTDSYQLVTSTSCDVQLQVESDATLQSDVTSTHLTRADSYQECCDELNAFMQMHNRTRQPTGPSITIRMARSFDEERACGMYLSSINYWRNINKINNKCARIKSRKLEILRQQLIDLQVKSPEEESCILKMNKCRSYRESLSINYQTILCMN